MSSSKKKIFWGIICILVGIEFLSRAGEYFRGALQTPIPGVIAIAYGIYQILIALNKNEK
jgi:uncharacterized membrane protein HdeD (DUF308 family)